ncbi:MAG: hypothetical protein M3Z31_02655 [Pseudomonadota bacterium]|nr:hypothetical protein [Pseudomonadota bacterium]
MRLQPRAESQVNALGACALQPAYVRHVVVIDWQSTHVAAKGVRGARVRSGMRYASRLANTLRRDASSAVSATSLSGKGIGGV